MSEHRHSLSLDIENDGREFFLSMKATGKLTHKDYEHITPMLESALDAVKDPKVKVFFDSTELEGFELRAAWDDFKMGLKYGNEFDKIAIYGNKSWVKQAAKIGSWFNSGEMKFFGDEKKAMDWLH